MCLHNRHTYWHNWPPLFLLRLNILILEIFNYIICKKQYKLKYYFLTIKKNFDDYCYSWIRMLKKKVWSWNKYTVVTSWQSLRTQLIIYDGILWNIWRAFEQYSLGDWAEKKKIFFYNSMPKRKAVLRSKYLAVSNCLPPSVILI